MDKLHNFLSLHVWSKNIVNDKFTSLYSSSSEFFNMYPLGSAGLEMPEVTRWTRVAVCALILVLGWGCLHPLSPSCSPSHHTSFWLRVRKYFGLGESEWSFWLWGCCTVWCAKSHQLSFAAFLLGNTWDRVTYPSQDVSSHLCCCCAVSEKCCHLEEHIFAWRLKSFLWVYVNDFCKYLCVCRWRRLPEQEAEEYVLRCCV